MYKVINNKFGLFRKESIIMETNIINKEITNEPKNSSIELSPHYNGLDVHDLNVPHNKLDIGGPTSAFSSLYSHAVSSKETLRNLSSDVHDYENVAKFEHQALQTNFFREKKSGIFQDIPVAPAFVQIYQRRRRRENRPRRQRTTFTSEQTLKLELEYGRADYITRPRRYELAEILSLSESQIKIWFQNRRAKDKRIEKAHMDHQLRAMGFPHFHGQYPFPVPNPGYCGACVSTPTPLPFLQPLCPTAQTKPFQLL